MAAKSLPLVKIQNVGGAQTNVSFTFGQVFAVGDLMPSEGLAGGTVPLQVDVKAAHQDGSVRHAVISGVLPKLAAGETVALQLAKGVRTSKSAVSLTDLSSMSGAVSITLGGKKYSSPTTGLIGTPWLSGDIVGEWFFTAPLKDENGDTHPNLTARFGVRYYPAAKQARVEFIIENVNTWAPGAKLNYDIELQLNGKSVYTKTGLDHYHHSRWHQYFWTGTAPQINVQLDPGYLIASKAVPNYDTSFAPSESDLAALRTGATGPMTIGPVTAYMPTTGGRSDIGSLPMWSVMWLLSQDKRARDVMMAAADGAGSWSVHYRDENTGLPVRTDNDKNKDITTHWNLRNSGPLPVPRFFNDNPDAPAGSYTPYTDDTAHQPSLVFLPYLITGDRYYLDELQFWAVSNPLGTDPNNSGHGLGLVRWLQLRGQAWAMRTLGHVAYITPDDDPLKGYFQQQLDNNLTFYRDTYVVGQPNNLGAYDGSGQGAFNEVSGGNFGAWQDDFLTWSFGYLGDLGFEKAAQLAQWKAQYPVARMTSPDMPWWLASTYSFKIRPAADKPLYGSIGEIYRATYGGDTIPNDDAQPRSAILNGKKFIDMEQYSQDQATVLGNANGYQWTLGRMVGYSDSAMGYPANLQPALATAVNAGVPNAEKAWSTFIGRTNQPDYHSAPQWAILPRNAENIMPAPISTTPAPATPTAKTLKIGAQPDGKGTWSKIAAENEHVKPATGAFVRYGINDKFVYAQASGEFDATNAAFGKDPAVNVVKQVEVFTPAKPVKPGKIKTPSNTLLKKLAKLTVKVMDPQSLKLVQTFTGVTASSTGVISLSDSALVEKEIYAIIVENAAGKVLDIMFPVTANS